MENKNLMKNIMLAAVFLVVTVLTCFGFQLDNQILETLCKILSGAGAALTLSFSVESIRIKMNKIRICTVSIDFPPPVV